VLSNKEGIMKKLAAVILLLSLTAPMHAAKAAGKRNDAKPSVQYILKQLLKRTNMSIPRLFHSGPKSYEQDPCHYYHTPDSRWHYRSNVVC
jgi:hypothetical protein